MDGVSYEKGIGSFKQTREIGLVASALSNS